MQSGEDTRGFRGTSGLCLLLSFTYSFVTSWLTSSNVVFVYLYAALFSFTILTQITRSVVVSSPSPKVLFFIPWLIRDTYTLITCSSTNLSLSSLWSRSLSSLWPRRHLYRLMICLSGAKNRCASHPAAPRSSSVWVEHLHVLLGNIVLLYCFIQAASSFDDMPVGGGKRPGTQSSFKFNIN